jgi:hypothetical protein
MIKWLSRQEKMYSFENYISWKDSHHAAANPHSQPLAHNLAGNVLSLPKHPTQPQQLISTIEIQHDTPGFSASLKEYLNLLTPHPTSARAASLYSLPFQRLDVYHTFKFHPSSLDDNEEECDTIKAAPPTKKRPGRFDNAVVLHTDDAESTGLEGALNDMHLISQTRKYSKC